MQTGICLTESRQADKAIAMYQRLQTSADFTPRDHGYFLALVSHALLQAAEPREAARTATEALTTAQRLSSRRTIAELRRLGPGLSPRRDVPDVRDLLDALAVA